MGFLGCTSGGRGGDSSNCIAGNTGPKVTAHSYNRKPPALLQGGLAYILSGMEPVYFGGTLIQPAPSPAHRLPHSYHRPRGASPLLNPLLHCLLAVLNRAEIWSSVLGQPGVHSRPSCYGRQWEHHHQHT